MITPKFSCDQDESAVIVSLYLPSIRASDVDLQVDGTLFCIHVNPYFLRLNFPSEVIEDDHSFATYDPSTAWLTVRLGKVFKGTNFDGLDLLAQLLAPPSQSVTSDLITEYCLDGQVEVVKGNTGSHLSSVDDEHKDSGNSPMDFDFKKEHKILLEAEKNDWRVPQGATTDHIFSPVVTQLTPTVSYGFQDLYSGYFKHMQYINNSVLELGPNSEGISQDDRRRLRGAHEQEKWDEEYYIADFINEEDIREIISWKSPFHPGHQPPPVMSEADNLLIMGLRMREYIIPAAESQKLYLTLLQILFAYCYDTRTTQSDPTSESAWTICSLTPCFSALDTSPSFSVTTVLRTSYIRALSFPLHRNWNLCEKCRTDLADILQGGRRYVSKALLDVKKILDMHEVYYVYSKIWVNDFIVWVQAYARDLDFRNLSTAVEGLVLAKSSLNLSLDELEQATNCIEYDSDDEQ